MWVCVGGEYGKLGGLKQLMVRVWYPYEFCELIRMVSGMVDGV